jgi:hypothetical protein
MQRILGRCRLPISLTLIALHLFLSSCSTWRPTGPLSEPVTREQRYTRLRVELVGGGVVTLRDPSFRGDTLYGRSDAKHDRGVSVAVPIEQIATLKARRPSGIRTTLFVAGLGVGLYACLLGLGLFFWND